MYFPGASALMIQFIRTQTLTYILFSDKTHIQMFYFLNEVLSLILKSYDLYYNFCELFMCYKYSIIPFKHCQIWTHF